MKFDPNDFCIDDVFAKLGKNKVKSSKSKKKKTVRARNSPSPVIDKIMSSQKFVEIDEPVYIGFA